MLVKWHQNNKPILLKAIYERKGMTEEEAEGLGEEGLVLPVLLATLTRLQGGNWKNSIKV
jgi:hypothetical protein